MVDIIPPRRDEFLTAGGIPTLRFAEFLEGEASQTNDNTDNLLLNFLASPALGDRQPEVISVSADFTTTGSQIVVCTNASDITITLNATPDDGEGLHIKRQNGGVFVSGLIDGTTGKRIRRRYDSPHLVFTVAAGEWSVV